VLAGWFYKCRLSTFTHQFTKKKEAKKKSSSNNIHLYKPSENKSKGAASLHTKPPQTHRLGSSKFVKEDLERNKAILFSKMTNIA